jgi:hypothetical protein
LGPSDTVGEPLASFGDPPAPVGDLPAPVGDPPAPVGDPLNPRETHVHQHVRLQNDRHENVRIRNSRLQNVRLPNVRFTKRPVYKMSGCQNVRFTRRPLTYNVRLENVRRRKSYKISIFYLINLFLKNVGNTKFALLFLVKNVSIYLISTLKRQYNNHEKCSINL